MKATLTAVALLFAIPGLAIAQDNNVDDKDLPETSQEYSTTTEEADGGATTEGTTGMVDCTDVETAVDEENLSDRAKEGDVVDSDAAACDPDDGMEAGTAVDADADMSDDNNAPVDESDLPERAQETEAVTE